MSLDGLTLLLKEAMSAAEVHHHLKHVHPNPSPAQRSYGNYRKGHITVSGLPVSIENPKGSFRSGVTKEGKPWKTQLQHHYGYIRRNGLAFDRDAPDCFINPDNPESFMVYIILQKDPSTGKFDEHKVMLGFRTRKDAEEAYLQNYQRGWKGLGGVLSMTIYGFRNWLKAGNARKNHGHLMDKKAELSEFLHSFLQKEASIPATPEARAFREYIKDRLAHSFILKSYARGKTQEARDLWKERLAELKKEFTAAGNKKPAVKAPPAPTNPEIDGYWDDHFKRTD